MRHKMDNDGPQDVAARVGEVVDMFSVKGTDGRSRGVHYLLGVLARNDKGGALPTVANILLILANDPPLAGMLAYNEFTGQALLMRAPPPASDNDKPLPGPYPRPWGAEDVSLVHAYLQRVWAAKMARDATENAMVAEAPQRRFHPVRDWLAGLKWDGIPRLTKWLVKAFGAPSDDYHDAIGTKVLIAAVRRVRRPGIKFDHLLLLEGEQGIGKSRAVEALFGRDWYSDAMPPNLAERDAAMSLLGVWCLELGEIDHLIRNEVETIKAFLSRSVDRYRPPYGKQFIERPRQGVMIGTTNASDYLRDHTGNRRMWPVRCSLADIEWLTANRDQIWAEAAAREESGEVLWLDDRDVAETATQQQMDRMQEDVWADAVGMWLNGHVEVRTGQILSECLSIPKAQQDKRTQMRVTAILTEFGWRRKLRRSGGRKPERVWIIPEGTQT